MNEGRKELMGVYIFHNSKLLSVKFKIHFKQFTNIRLLLTADKLDGEQHLFSGKLYRKRFFIN